MPTCRLEVPQWLGYRVFVVEVTADTYEAAREAAWSKVLSNADIKWRKHWWQFWHPNYKVYVKSREYF